VGRGFAVKILSGLILGGLSGVIAALALGALAGANPPCGAGDKHMSAFDQVWNELGWGAMANFPAIAPFTVLIGGGLGAFIGYRHQRYGGRPHR
jgi:hypothetical protein